MNRIRMLATVAALGIATTIGAAGTASAFSGHSGWNGQPVTQEQQAAAQEVFAEYNKRAAPLQQQLMAKRSELDAQYYGQKTDDARVQALFKEIADIESKLYAADTELRTKLVDKGLDTGGYGGYGMHSYGGGGMHHGSGRHGGHRW